MRKTGEGDGECIVSRKVLTKLELQGGVCASNQRSAAQLQQRAEEEIVAEDIKHCSI